MVGKEGRVTGGKEEGLRVKIREGLRVKKGRVKGGGKRRKGLRVEKGKGKGW